MTQQPPEDRPQDSVSFNKFSGIKNIVERERLAPDELEVARNVDIDDAGQLRRRRGYTLVSAGVFHSLFTAADGTIYGGKNNALGLIYPNYNFQSLSSDVGPSPIAYVQVGDTIYFSSETVSGKIHHPTKVVSAWGAIAADSTWLSPVVNPVTDLPPIKGEMLGKPPLATALTYFNGRIYLANRNVVWATKLYLYDYVELTKTFMMYESDITMLGAVTDGIYVGTKDAIWFQSGAFNEMRRIRAVDTGALAGSMVTVTPDALPGQLPTSTRSAILVLTSGGLYACIDGGNTMNLTGSKVVFPESLRVNSLFREQDGVNQYIGIADSAGTPRSNARIGDYVDAEIRRFQGA